MENFVESLQNTLGASMPGLFGALIILVVGWIAANVLKAVVKKAFELIKLNNLFKTKMDIAGGIASCVYYVVLLFMLLGVFNALDLQIASEPIQNLLNSVFAFLPKLVAGAILGVVAWLIAKIARDLITSGLGSTGIDNKLGGSAPISQTLGNVVYGFILLMFLPAILGIFEIQGLIDPVEGMIDKILGFVPNIFAAVVIAVVGWFIAKILKDVVSNLLSAAGADKAGETIGLAGSMTLSKIVGVVVYVFVLLPAIISALNALEMEAISGPATEMLSKILNLLPNVVAAVIILVLTYMIANVVAKLITNLSHGIGLDQVPAKIGLKGILGDDGASVFVGKVVVFFMMLFATVEAANQVGFSQVSELVTFFIQFGGQVVLGSIIIAIGLWIANIAYDSIKKASNKAMDWMAGVVRIVILGLVFAMGLRSMGVANDIINMAFGLTLGAAAIACALAFGIGGRNAAGKIADKWASKF